jgi:hypothetical protein
MKVVGLLFFDEDAITSNSFLDIFENYVLPQLNNNNNNNFILQLDCAPVHFAHIDGDCLDVKFPGRWIGRGGPIA